MTNDYRNTDYCQNLESLKEKKEKIAALIKKDHPKVEDMHFYISKNKLQYKTEFMKVYNSKCGYCGASTDILPREMFEVDHFICIKHSKSKSDAGEIENLVLSCYTCNRKKGSILLNETTQGLLHPDGSEIQKVFQRDELWNIVIDPKFSSEEVKEFYNRIEFDSDIRRIDWLLMNMIGFQKSCLNEEKKYTKLGQAIDKLREKRNFYSDKNSKCKNSKHNQ